MLFCVYICISTFDKRLRRGSVGAPVPTLLNHWSTKPAAAVQTLLFQHSVCLPGVGSQWDFWGSTLVTSSYVRLTPDERSKQGSIWNTVVRKETGTRLLSQFQCRLYGQQHMILHFTVCNPPTPPPHKHPRTRLSRYTHLFIVVGIICTQEWLRTGTLPLVPQIHQLSQDKLCLCLVSWKSS